MTSEAEEKLFQDQSSISLRNNQEKPPFSFRFLGKINLSWRYPSAI